MVNSLKITGLADPEIIAVVELLIVISCQEFTMGKDRQWYHQLYLFPQVPPPQGASLHPSSLPVPPAASASHISTSPAHVGCTGCTAGPTHSPACTRLLSVPCRVGGGCKKWMWLYLVNRAHTFRGVINRSDPGPTLLTFKNKNKNIFLPFSLSSCEWNDHGVIIITCYGWLVLWIWLTLVLCWFPIIFRNMNF